MSNYFLSKNKSDCNGCGVCFLKCPQKAIEMQIDKEGFLYPIIDKEKCIECKLCEKICPNKEYKINDKVTAYIAINKDEEQLKSSASGGCFLPIAQYIISQKGVVFGARYDNNLNVIHDYTEEMDKLKMFQGSKYVRSDLNNAYIKVKQFLLDNRYVLFSGTPCQCQGLRTYLGKTYEKLYTCEIICHANSSPRVFNLYKKNLEKNNNKGIEDIRFRDKSNGWKNQKTIIKYSDGTIQEDLSFYLGFVNELFNRPSCHNCNFCSSNRLSDFTIGDAWGINEIDPSIIDDDTGISLFCMNTEKGMKLKNIIEKKLNLRKTNVEIAFKHNHYQNVKEHKKRKEFFEKIDIGEIDEKNIIDNIKMYTKVSFIQKCLNKIKAIYLKIKK